MKTILLAFCLIVISAFSYAQTISGYVKDAATKEAIPFASIKAKLESDSVPSPYLAATKRVIIY